MSRRRVGFASISICLASACGGAAGVDAGIDASGADGGTSSCASAIDGTPCGAGLICVGGDCSATRCGDAVTDRPAGEQCDDGNEIAFDGCTSCMIDCETDVTCDDSDPCTGLESCDTGIHRCVAGTALAEGAACVTRTIADGVCRTDAATSTCVAAGCANGVAESGEDCDDGANGDPDDGCRDDCTFTCGGDADCSDSDSCTGMETCDSTSHTCVAGTALVCDDGNACTMNGCVAATGCAYPLIDGDGDSHAPSSLGTCGDDCNDASAIVFAGAPEPCDGMDNDCNGVVDDDRMTWWADCDDDGYGLTGASMRDACTEPAPSPCGGGWTTRNPAATPDCNDANAVVHPGAAEICDRLDDDCSAGGGVLSAEDSDDDGYASSSAACTGGPRPRTDCDDTRPTVHPGVTEICNRGVDDNCNGNIDEGCGCSFIGITSCDTTRTILQSCSVSGRYVGRLRRCDSTFYSPADSYLSFHLCSCALTTGCCTGVGFQDLECCTSPTVAP